MPKMRGRNSSLREFERYRFVYSNSTCRHSTKPPLPLLKKPANKTANLRPQGDPQLPKNWEKGWTTPSTPKEARDRCCHPQRCQELQDKDQSSASVEMELDQMQTVRCSSRGDQGSESEEIRVRPIQDRLDGSWHLNSAQSMQNWTMPSRKWHHSKKRLHSLDKNWKRPRNSTGHNGLSSPRSGRHLKR
jgi:hypothetical protein